jgi:hypothetical protein
MTKTFIPLTCKELNFTVEQDENKFSYAFEKRTKLKLKKDTWVEQFTTQDPEKCPILNY